jgi:hybrid cluster-associated redox disulfide protein
MKKTDSTKIVPPKKGSEQIVITKDMNLGEVAYKFPESAEILLDFGLHCVGCFASSFDTIEVGAKVHGMSDAEITEMIERINEVINYKE